MSASAPLVPRPAASVILVRPSPARSRPAGQLEVFLVQRHGKASFMSSAYVFPGGVADDGEDDLRVTAARELFEEAGVLLADRPLAEAVAAAERARWRAALHADETTLGALLAGAGAAVAVDELLYFAHWITPELEGARRRYSAQFFVAALPDGEPLEIDNREIVAATWATPDDALARAGELALPPPQVRTLMDMREAAREGLDALRALAAERARHPFPILPRLAAARTGPGALLLPWDPEYADAGAGEARVMPADHPLAAGPSRFILEGTAWKNVYAPRSPGAA